MLIGLILGAGATLSAAFFGPYSRNLSDQIILPSPKKPDISGPTLVESRFSCQTDVVTAANRAWIEACYVTGKLDAACQQLFYDDGSYLSASSTSAQYKHDEQQCACALPITLATDLNNEASDAWNSCSDYPPNAQLLY